MVHVKKNMSLCVWSGSKLDSTTKRECFSAFWVHGYLKTQAFMGHGRKNVYGLETSSTVRQKENVSLHFGCMVI